MTNQLKAAFTMELSIASRKMRNLFDSQIREHGLTLARARALILLSKNRDWNQRELANALEIEHPSVVKLLDGLERQGLIIRVPAQSDRRAKRIELTSEAEIQIRHLDDITEAIRQKLLEDIDPKALQIALEVLQAVTQKAEKTASE